MRLFEERGYEQTTMDEIADAARISRQTLFRLFPAKADLVWHELSTSLEDAFAAVDAERAPQTLMQIVGRVFRTPAELDDPDQVESFRRRLRLFGSTPALMRHTTLDTLHARMTAAISRASDLNAPAELVARALVAAGVAAVIWWADHDDVDDPAQLLELTLRSLGDAGRGVPDVPTPTEHPDGPAGPVRGPRSVRGSR